MCPYDPASISPCIPIANADATAARRLRVPHRQHYLEPGVAGHPHHYMRPLRRGMLSVGLRHRTWTPRQNWEIRMRSIHLKLACLVACALAVSGCFESLTDIATPDKVVFYDDLVGDYAAVEPATGRLTLE